jgi:hypothetical protein
MNCPEESRWCGPRTIYCELRNRSFESALLASTPGQIIFAVVQNKQRSVAGFVSAELELAMGNLLFSAILKAFRQVGLIQDFFPGSLARQNEIFQDRLPFAFAAREICGVIET